MGVGGVSRFYLGANSAKGFYSLYEDFTAPESGCYVRVIKGSPGCGKSTLMRRIGAAAEAAGLTVEYIHCSGDPDSLDGVRLPERGVCWVDGTAPHVIEPVCPGAGGDYLDMSCLLDPSLLRQRLDAMEDCTARYRALYALAYRQLAALAPMLPRNDPSVREEPGLARAKRRALGLARRLPPLQKAGTVRRRFLSALSCQGVIRMTDTLAPYPQRLLLDNALGFGNTFLCVLAEAARARGYAVTVCCDPLEPERIEAVLLPEAGLSALACDPLFLPQQPVGRRVHLESSVPAARLRELRPRQHEAALLLDAATDSLARAKALHDELEGFYRGAVDFEAANRLAEREIKRYL